jgi:predicted dehydrogenase
VKFSAFVIGLGSIGMGYDYEDGNSWGITHCRAIQKHSKFEFVGAHDLDKDNGKRFQKEYKSQFFPDLGRGLRETVPDLVIIATPTDSHLSILKTVLKFSSPKVILCEKPLSYVAHEAHEILELATSHNIKMFVNYFRNSQPYIRDVADQIASGALELPAKGRCLYSKGAFNTGTHFLNLLESIFGEITDVTVSQESKRFRESGDMDLNAEIKIGNSIFTLEYVSGVDDLIFEMEVWFQNGCLRYLNEGSEIKWESSSVDTLGDFYARSFLTLPSRTQFEVLEEISNYLEGRNYALCELIRGVRYIELLSETGER